MKKQQIGSQKSVKQCYQELYELSAELRGVFTHGFIWYLIGESYLARAAKSLLSLMKAFAFAHEAPVENVYTFSGQLYSCEKSISKADTCTQTEAKTVPFLTSYWHLLKGLHASTVAWIFESTFCETEGLYVWISGQQHRNSTKCKAGSVLGTTVAPLEPRNNGQTRTANWLNNVVPSVRGFLSSTAIRASSR